MWPEITSQLHSTSPGTNTLQTCNGAQLQLSQQSEFLQVLITQSARLAPPAAAPRIFQTTSPSPLWTRPLLTCLLPACSSPTPTLLLLFGPFVGSQTRRSSAPSSGPFAMDAFLHHSTYASLRGNLSPQCNPEYGTPHQDCPTVRTLALWNSPETSTSLWNLLPGTPLCMDTLVNEPFIGP
jgi:hypothetical protein